jgi:hypothetical protein
MLISQRSLARIDEIIDKAYLGFAFSLVGEDFLSDEQKMKLASLGIIVGRRPLIELLYILARQRTEPGTYQNQALSDVMMSILSMGHLPIINDESQYTIDHAKVQVQELVENAKQDLRKRVKQEILTANLAHKEQRAVERKNQKEEALLGLMGRLDSIVSVGAVAAAFKKEFVTAVTNAINSSVVDELRMLAGFESKTSEDEKVFKQVVWDNRLSPECKRLYTNPDGSPRLFTLKELEQNGSNVGRPKSQWKAVIGATHPNCRCTLKKATPEMIRLARRE